MTVMALVMAGGGVGCTRTAAINNNKSVLYAICAIEAAIQFRSKLIRLL